MGRARQADRVVAGVEVPTHATSIGKVGRKGEQLTRWLDEHGRRVGEVVRGEQVLHGLEMMRQEQVVIPQVGDQRCPGRGDDGMACRFVAAGHLWPIDEGDDPPVGSADVGHDVPGVVTDAVTDDDELEVLHPLVEDTPAAVRAMVDGWSWVGRTTSHEG